MYLAIDIGGTNTRVASSADLGSIYKIERFPTATQLTEQKVCLSNAIKAVIDNTDIKHIEAICIGVPGIVDKKNRLFKKIANAPYLSGLQYHEMLEGAFANTRIHSENDATLAALGEAVYGAGKEYETIAYLTISTGVGGARISNKRLDPSQKFSEPGHHIINVGGDLDTKINLQGTFEAYVSGQALERELGVAPQNSSDPKIWETYGHRLAHGMINVCAFWAPDAIILGGGVANRFDAFIEPLKQNFQKQDFFEMPEFLKAKLGDYSGIYGCLAFFAAERRT